MRHSGRYRREPAFPVLRVRHDLGQPPVGFITDNTCVFANPERTNGFSSGRIQLLPVGDDLVRRISLHVSTYLYTTAIGSARGQLIWYS